jgi:translocation and assembly module TamB
VARPEITGNVDIRRGWFTFQGHRYTIPRGTVSFDNPTSFEPFFDVEAFTRLRAPGQTFNVTLRINGTLDKFEPTITSEPWLPEFQILSLLLGETPDIETAELRARSSSQELQRQAMQSMMVTLLASPLSSRIGGVFERFGAVDTVDIVPLLGTETSLQQLNPTARIVLGKRVSDRVYVTYSRTFSASQYEVILIEYDQNDRVSWVLSRNEDRSFSLDFRLRYVF